LAYFGKTKLISLKTRHDLHSVEKNFVQKIQDLVPKFLSTKSASSSFSTETESHVLSLQVVLGKNLSLESCGTRIYHDKWTISPRLAEDRWAHKEAKKRELDDVIDAFS